MDMPFGLSLLHLLSFEFFNRSATAVKVLVITPVASIANTAIFQMVTTIKSKYLVLLDLFKQ